MTRFRRAGARWRLLVHDMAPGGTSSRSRHILSHPPDRPDGPHTDTTVLEGTEFDELVVGGHSTGPLIHVEQMDTNVWWASFGGVVLRVKADRDGKPLRVVVDLEDPREGCTYTIRGDET